MSLPVPSVGVKGSDVYSSSGDPRVDLNVKCVRGATGDDLEAALKAVMGIGTQQAVEDAFVLAFNARNIRGGKGERDIFHKMMARLYGGYPWLVLGVLEFVPHYGCWSDLLTLGDPEAAPIEFRDATLALFMKQLKEDSASTEGTISLAGKWAPREGSANKKYAQLLAHRLFPHDTNHSSIMRKYRTLTASLNARLKTVETYMCADRWDEIAPEGVPGRAGKLYNRAFLNLPTTYRVKDAEAPTGEFRHPDDEKRMACRAHFEAYLKKASEGKAKINGADTIFPHELVRKAIALIHSDGVDPSEKAHVLAVWRAMLEKAKAGGGLRRSLMMSDFSGSMQSSSVGDLPYYVSMAIGLLGAEVCSDEFKDLLMGFDSDPHLLQFPAESDLFERIRIIQSSRIGNGLSTNFQAALDLVLKRLKEKRCRPGEEPENLIVITDMGWDQACGSSDRSQYTGYGYRHVVKTAPWETQVAMIQESFKRAGEDMWGPGQGFTAPRIVIWNVAASAQTDFHATADTPGVAMLSGWSPTQFEILQKEGPRQMTAYEMLRLDLDDPKYQRVRERIRELMLIHKED